MVDLAGLVIYFPLYGAGNLDFRPVLVDATPLSGVPEG
jgi:hypothetical protein